VYLSYLCLFLLIVVCQPAAFRLVRAVSLVVWK
jgi:hypothetical protein